MIIVYIIQEATSHLKKQFLSGFSIGSFVHTYIFLIGTHSTQGWTATTRQGVTRKINKGRKASSIADWKEGTYSASKQLKPTYRKQKTWYTHITLRVSIVNVNRSAAAYLFTLTKEILKGYVRCKMITSQTVSSEAQLTNIFIS